MLKHKLFSKTFFAPAKILISAKKATLPIFSASVAIFFTSAVLAQTINPAQTPQINLERAELRIGMYKIDAQLAKKPKEREIGLMHRKNMPAHEGMLFIFEEKGVQCFWMKNTLIPLTAAFIDDDGKIVNLADMKPLDESSHCSEKPVKYVLEMNQGWFTQKHINAGNKIKSEIFNK